MLSMTDIDHKRIFNIHIIQCWVDVAMWETFLNEYKEARAFIELGTYEGGMSIFFLLQAIQRGMKFWTFDNKRWGGLSSTLAKYLKLDDHFIMEDILQERSPKLLSLIGDPENHPLILYCDNGNKKMELLKYVPLLQNGDYVVTHDWKVEVFPDDITPITHLLEPLFWNDCETLGGTTRFWRRK